MTLLSVTVDTTITVSNLITIATGISTLIGVIFGLWFKNQTAKFVTYKTFQELVSTVQKLEQESKVYFGNIDTRLKSIEDTGKLKHDYVVKELEHINNNVKNSDRGYSNMEKLFDLLYRKEKDK